MKLNWKVVIAVVIGVGAIIWAATSLITHTYSGTELVFGVGSGPVTLTNSSQWNLPITLVSTSPRTFTVSSSNSGVSGRSISQGTGRNTTQLYEFTLPPGISELTVSRGENVSFISNTDTPLKAVVKPLSDNDLKARLIITVITVVGSLFYLSWSNDHRWISATRRQKAADQAAAQAIEQEKFKSIFGRMSKSTKKSQLAEK